MLKSIRAASITWGFFTLLWPIGLRADGPECTVQITVTNSSDSKSLPGAEVALRKKKEGEPLYTDGKEPPISHILTDQQGQVIIDGLIPGQEYYVVVHFPSLSSAYKVFTCSPPSVVIDVALDEFLDVSLIQLIANPNRWDGKLVQVIGFINIEFEGNALYLHKEDWRRGLEKNALWLDLTLARMGELLPLRRHYVIIRGRFDGKRYGHMSLFSGEITQIDRCDPWKF